MSNAIKQLSEIQEQIEQLESKTRQFESLLLTAEQESYQKGFEAGLSATVQEFDGKTVVVFAPEEQHDTLMTSLRKLRRELNCKFVVVSDAADMKDLHELDLKAIGLKRLEE